MNSKAVSIGAVAVISVATGIVLMAPRASEPSRRSDRAAIQEQPSGTARIGRGIPDGTIKRASPDHRSVPGGPDAVLDRSRAAGDPRTWVEANRPLVTASDHTVADLETDMLRVFRGMIEGRAPGQRDLLRFITAEDALRLAFDEDLNGVLDDEEVARFHEAQARFDPNTHPFVEQVMDLDGDGTVSDEERMTAMERFQEGSAAILEEMSHLPTLVYWDDNLDGQVDDAERSLRMNDPSVIAQFDTD
ncbi:MAG: EF-hand domain-containing protein, partial [Planctomycetota bacterium]